MIFEPFTIVKVPFPFTDQKESKRRPALVLSTVKFQQKNGHVCLAMITTAKKSDWWGDVEISDLNSAGLKVASVIRPKIFTLDNGLILGNLGVLSLKDLRELKAVFREAGVVEL